MKGTPYNFCKVLSEELDTEKLRQKFLASLLELQNLERGSIWVRRGDGYQCVEATGSQSENIRGMTISATHPSIVGWVIENGKMTIGEPGKDVRHYKEAEANFDIKSQVILCFPLFLKSGEVYGAVQLIDTNTESSLINLGQEYLDLLQQLIDIGSIALANSLVYMDQVKENQRLKEKLEAIQGEGLLLGQSPSFLQALKMARDYARTDFPVLITGESGTGKELIAREIHRMSNRKDKPFLVQNCSAIPDTLLESELFGYEKGAFTGANRDKIGLFEAADTGTVFLDEIGDMPLQLQARILRVVQYNEIKPLGGTKTRKVDVRILSATNKDLSDAIAREQFREDLFYRLNVLPLPLPPLRERKEDIPLLLHHMLVKECKKMGVQPKKLSQDAVECLVQYPWRGNIRELENFVRHIIVVTGQNVITSKDFQAHFIPTRVPEAANSGTDQSCHLDHPNYPGHLDRSGHHDHHDADHHDWGPSGERRSASHEKPDATGLQAAFAGHSWEQVERAYVRYLLDKNRWHITRAAKEAGVNRSTFDSRMKRLGIRK